MFIIGHLRGSSTRKVFPITGERRPSVDIQGQHTGTITTRTGVNGTVGTYIVEGEQFSQKINQIGNLIDTDSFGGNPQVGRVYGTDGISPCLNTMGGGGREPKVAIPVLAPDRSEKRQNGRRFKEDGYPMFTLTAQDRHGVMVKDQKYIDGISDKYSFAKKKAQGMLNENGELPERFNPYNAQEIDEVSPTLTTCCGHHTSSSTVLMKQPNFRIRKLTPKECWRLQGFPDWAFERARAVGVSDSQLYKQAGNSVTVNVVYEIAKRLR